MASIIDRANRDYGAVTLTVAVPQPMSQFMDSMNLKRLLTLKPLEDFAELSGRERALTILKVITVGLLTLGIGAAAALASPVTIWSIPLAMIVAMGLSFSFITYEKSGRELLDKEKDKKPAPVKYEKLVALPEERPVRLCRLVETQTD